MVPGLRNEEGDFNRTPFAVGVRHSDDCNVRYR